MNTNNALIYFNRKQGVDFDPGLPGLWRRGCSCSDDEAKAWARENASSKANAVEVNATDDSASTLDSQAVVFLCRVLDTRDGRRFPVL